MKPQFTITLEASNAKDQGEASRALRAALKYLLRAFGLKCVRLSEGGTDEQEAGRERD